MKQLDLSKIGGVGLNTFSIWCNKCALMHMKKILYKKRPYHGSRYLLHINHDTAVCVDIIHHFVHNPGQNVVLRAYLLYKAQLKTARNFLFVAEFLRVENQL